jgi:urate oxidase
MEALTEVDVQKTINLLTDMILKTFPGIQLVFAIGNHDFEPSNY